MKVAILMGSKSDFETVKAAFLTLKKFGVHTEVRVISAHRTPHIAAQFAESAKKNGFEVIIAAAGKAAHLGGVLAAFTTLPVIGLPIKSSTMDGMDSLLSMVQMPSGVPVACVGINAAENAALTALQILGIKYPEISAKLEKHKKDMEEAIVKDDEVVVRLAESAE